MGMHESKYYITCEYENENHQRYTVEASYDCANAAVRQFTLTNRKMAVLRERGERPYSKEIGDAIGECSYASFELWTREEGEEITVDWHTYRF